MDADETVMRRKFDEAVVAILSQKREDNKAFLSAEEYECRLTQLKRSKVVLRTPGEKKCMKDYRMVRKYDIRMVDGRERLVRPAKTGAGPTAEPLFYVTNDELFDVLHRAHGDIGHGGRNRMVERLRAGYCNVTKEAVMTYLKLCAVCARKTRRSAASATDGGGARADDAWPRTPDEFVGSRALIELIDMQAHEVDGYRFVVNHRDDATKFTHLVPVRSIRPEAVAVGLLDVYAAFGVPAVLESRCGREYVESVIEHVRSAWPADCCLRIEYAECRGPSSSWPGCGATPPVGDALEDWMARNDCHDWPVALKFLQLQVNCCFDPDIGMSPYQAIFGYPASGDWLSTDFSFDKYERKDVDTAIVKQDLDEYDDEKHSEYLKVETTDAEME